MFLKYILLISFTEEDIKKQTPYLIMYKKDNWGILIDIEYEDEDL